MNSEVPKPRKRGKRRSGEIDSLAVYRNMKKQPNIDAAENLRNLLQKISETTPSVSVKLEDNLKIEPTTVQIGTNQSFEIGAQDLLDIIYETSIMGLTGTAALERERRKLKQNPVQKKITDIICIS